MGQVLSQLDWVYDPNEGRWRLGLAATQPRRHAHNNNDNTSSSSSDEEEEEEHQQQDDALDDTLASTNNDGETKKQHKKKRSKEDKDNDDAFLLQHSAKNERVLAMLYFSMVQSFCHASGAAFNEEDAKSSAATLMKRRFDKPLVFTTPTETVPMSEVEGGLGAVEPRAAASTFLVARNFAPAFAELEGDEEEDNNNPMMTAMGGGGSGGAGAAGSANPRPTTTSPGGRSYGASGGFRHQTLEQTRERAAARRAALMHVQNAATTVNTAHDATKFSPFHHYLEIADAGGRCCFARQQETGAVVFDCMDDDADAASAAGGDDGVITSSTGIVSTAVVKPYTEYGLSVIKETMIASLSAAQERREQEKEEEEKKKQAAEELASQQQHEELEKLAAQAASADDDDGGEDAGKQQEEHDKDTSLEDPETQQQQDDAAAAGDTPGPGEQQQQNAQKDPSHVFGGEQSFFGFDHMKAETIADVLQEGSSANAEGSTGSSKKNDDEGGDTSAAAAAAAAESSSGMFGSSSINSNSHLHQSGGRTGTVVLDGQQQQQHLSEKQQQQQQRLGVQVTVHSLHHLMVYLGLVASTAAAQDIEFALAGEDGDAVQKALWDFVQQSPGFLHPVTHHHHHHHHRSSAASRRGAPPQSPGSSSSGRHHRSTSPPNTATPRRGGPGGVSSASSSATLHFTRQPVFALRSLVSRSGMTLFPPRGTAESRRLASQEEHDLFFTAVGSQMAVEMCARAVAFQGLFQPFLSVSFERTAAGDVFASRFSSSSSSATEGGSSPSSGETAASSLVQKLLAAHRGLRARLSPEASEAARQAIRNGELLAAVADARVHGVVLIASGSTLEVSLSTPRTLLAVTRELKLVLEQQLRHCPPTIHPGEYLTRELLDLTFKDRLPLVDQLVGGAHTQLARSILGCRGEAGSLFKLLFGLMERVPLPEASNAAESSGKQHAIGDKPAAAAGGEPGNADDGAQQEGDDGLSLEQKLVTSIHASPCRRNKQQRKQQQQQQQQQQLTVWKQEDMSRPPSDYVNTALRTVVARTTKTSNAILERIREVSHVLNNTRHHHHHQHRGGGGASSGGPGSPRSQQSLDGQQQQQDGDVMPYYGSSAGGDEDVALTGSGQTQQQQDDPKELAALFFASHQDAVRGGGGDTSDDDNDDSDDDDGARHNHHDRSHGDNKSSFFSGGPVSVNEERQLQQWERAIGLIQSRARLVTRIAPHPLLATTTTAVTAQQQQQQPAAAEQLSYGDEDGNAAPAEIFGATAKPGETASGHAVGSLDSSDEEEEEEEAADDDALERQSSASTAPGNNNDDAAAGEQQQQQDGDNGKNNNSEEKKKKRRRSKKKKNNAKSELSASLISAPPPQERVFSRAEALLFAKTLLFFVASLREVDNDIIGNLHSMSLRSRAIAVGSSASSTTASSSSAAAALTSAANNDNNRHPPRAEYVFAEMEVLRQFAVRTAAAALPSTGSSSTTAAWSPSSSSSAQKQMVINAGSLPPACAESQRVQDVELILPTVTAVFGAPRVRPLGELHFAIKDRAPLASSSSRQGSNFRSPAPPPPSGSPFGPSMSGSFRRQSQQHQQSSRSSGAGSAGAHRQLVRVCIFAGGVLLFPDSSSQQQHSGKGFSSAPSLANALGAVQAAHRYRSQFASSHESTLLQGVAASSSSSSSGGGGGAAWASSLSLSATTGISRLPNRTTADQLILHGATHYNSIHELLVNLLPEAHQTWDNLFAMHRLQQQIAAASQAASASSLVVPARPASTTTTTTTTTTASSRPTSAGARGTTTTMTPPPQLVPTPDLLMPSPTGAAGGGADHDPVGVVLCDTMPRVLPAATARATAASSGGRPSNLMLPDDASSASDDYDDVAGNGEEDEEEHPFNQSSSSVFGSGGGRNKKRRSASQQQQQQALKKRRKILSISAAEVMIRQERDRQTQEELDRSQQLQLQKQFDDALHSPPASPLSLSGTAGGGTLRSSGTTSKAKTPAKGKKAPHPPHRRDFGDTVSVGTSDAGRSATTTTMSSSTAAAANLPRPLFIEDVNPSQLHQSSLLPVLLAPRLHGAPILRSIGPPLFVDMVTGLKQHADFLARTLSASNCSNYSSPSPIYAGTGGGGVGGNADPAAFRSSSGGGAPPASPASSSCSSSSNNPLGSPHPLAEGSFAWSLGTRWFISAETQPSPIFVMLLSTLDHRPVLRGLANVAADNLPGGASRSGTSSGGGSGGSNSRDPVTGLTSAASAFIGSSGRGGGGDGGGMMGAGSSFNNGGGGGGSSSSDCGAAALLRDASVWDKIFRFLDAPKYGQRAPTPARLLYALALVRDLTHVLDGFLTGLPMGVLSLAQQHDLLDGYLYASLFQLLEKNFLRAVQNIVRLLCNGQTPHRVFSRGLSVLSTYIAVCSAHFSRLALWPGGGPSSSHVGRGSSANLAAAAAAAAASSGGGGASSSSASSHVGTETTPLHRLLWVGLSFVDVRGLIAAVSSRCTNVLGVLMDFAETEDEDALVIAMSDAASAAMMNAAAAAASSDNNTGGGDSPVTQSPSSAARGTGSIVGAAEFLTDDATNDPEFIQSLKLSGAHETAALVVTSGAQFIAVTSSASADIARRWVHGTGTGTQQQQQQQQQGQHHQQQHYHSSPAVFFLEQIFATSSIPELRVAFYYTTLAWRAILMLSSPLQQGAAGMAAVPRMTHGSPYAEISGSVVAEWAVPLPLLKKIASATVAQLTFAATSILPDPTVASLLCLVSTLHRIAPAPSGALFSTLRLDRPLSAIWEQLTARHQQLAVVAMHKSYASGSGGRYSPEVSVEQQQQQQQHHQGSASAMASSPEASVRIAAFDDFASSMRGSASSGAAAGAGGRRSRDAAAAAAAVELATEITESELFLALAWATAVSEDSLTLPPSISQWTLGLFEHTTSQGQCMPPVVDKYSLQWSAANPYSKLITGGSGAGPASRSGGASSPAGGAQQQLSSFSSRGPAASIFHLSMMRAFERCLTEPSPTLVSAAAANQRFGAPFMLHMWTALVARTLPLLLASHSSQLVVTAATGSSSGLSHSPSFGGSALSRHGSAVLSSSSSSPSGVTGPSRTLVVVSGVDVAIQFAFELLTMLSDARDTACEVLLFDCVDLDILTAEKQREYVEQQQQQGRSSSSSSKSPPTSPAAPTSPAPQQDGSSSPVGDASPTGINTATVLKARRQAREAAERKATEAMKLTGRNLQQHKLLKPYPDLKDPLPALFANSNRVFLDVHRQFATEYQHGRQQQQQAVASSSSSSRLVTESNNGAGDVTASLAQLSQSLAEAAKIVSSFATLIPALDVLFVPHALLQICRQPMPWVFSGGGAAAAAAASPSLLDNSGTPLQTSPSLRMQRVGSHSQFGSADGGGTAEPQDINNNNNNSSSSSSHFDLPLAQWGASRVRSLCDTAAALFPELLFVPPERQRLSLSLPGCLECATALRTLARTLQSTCLHLGGNIKSRVLAEQNNPELMNSLQSTDNNNNSGGAVTAPYVPWPFAEWTRTLTVLMSMLENVVTPGGGGGGGGMSVLRNTRGTGPLIVEIELSILTLSAHAAMLVPNFGQIGPAASFFVARYAQQRGLMSPDADLMGAAARQGGGGGGGGRSLDSTEILMQQHRCLRVAVLTVVDALLQRGAVLIAEAAAQGLDDDAASHEVALTQVLRELVGSGVVAVAQHVLAPSESRHRTFRFSRFPVSALLTSGIFGTRTTTAASASAASAANTNSNSSSSTSTTTTTTTAALLAAIPSIDGLSGKNYETDRCTAIVFLQRLLVVAKRVGATGTTLQEYARRSVSGTLLSILDAFNSKRSRVDQLTSGGGAKQQLPQQLPTTSSLPSPRPAESESKCSLELVADALLSTIHKFSDEHIGSAGKRKF